MRRGPQRVRTRLGESHPDEEALLVLLDKQAPPAVAEHVASCPDCGRRVAELQTIRRVLQATAARQAAPSRDLAGAAVARATVHRATIGGVNEFLAIVDTLVRGVALLVGGARPDHAPRRGPPPRSPRDAGGGDRG